MKIAIISDVHDNLANLKTCLDWCGENNIEKIFCCGDLVGQEALDYLALHFSGTIHYVSGNADFIDAKDAEGFDNFVHHGALARTEIDGLTIGMCHQPYLLEKVLELGKCDIVFYGHTHKPWEEERLGVRFVNPGTLSAMFQLATFAVFDTSSKELELKVLNNLNKR